MTANNSFVEKLKSQIQFVTIQRLKIMIGNSIA